MHILYFLLIGLIAGFLAGKIMRGTGFGVIGDIIVGCIGALLGGWLLGLLGVAWGGVIGSLITALIGALVLIWLVGLIRKA